MHVRGRGYEDPERCISTHDPKTKEQFAKVLRSKCGQRRKESVFWEAEEEEEEEEEGRGLVLGDGVC